MIAKDEMYNRVIHHALKQKVDQLGNREFFYFGDEVFGYEDFERESSIVAAGLQEVLLGGDTTEVAQKIDAKIKEAYGQ